MNAALHDSQDISLNIPWESWTFLQSMSLKELMLLQNGDKMFSKNGECPEILGLSVHPRLASCKTQKQHMYF